MLITNNITMQFGSKPLFEDISIKFGDGNRYGLIGANGCGKSTFMKILAKELEPTSCLLYTSDDADDSLRVDLGGRRIIKKNIYPVSYTHLRAHETDSYLVCRLLLEKT
mgnify:CR=1 FL=1